MNKKWYLYVLKCKDNTLYTGITTDMNRRLFEHNNTKKGAKYTRTRRPVLPVFVIECDSRSDALKKEYRFKRLSRKKKLEVINGKMGFF